MNHMALKIMFTALIIMLSVSLIASFNKGFNFIDEKSAVILVCSFVISAAVAEVSAIFFIWGFI